MITTIHQPDFMPWIGYFDKIKNSDILIYLDDVQFSKGSYIKPACDLVIDDKAKRIEEI